MKKTVLLFIFTVLFLIVSVFSVQAEVVRHCWYCVHVKNHVQPSVDGKMAFIEDYGGFYIDHRNKDANATEKVIYLTFDAGYENGNVEKTLDILKSENVPAAFFILSNLLTKNSDLVKRMLHEGHIVANHTSHHKDMSQCSNELFLEELHSLEKFFYDCTGTQMPKYYRPPEGVFSVENLKCAQENGYKTIFWSFAYPDWDNQKQLSAEKAKQIILENAHNGEVMLLHPTSATNVEVLGEVIRALKADGYRFASLHELVGGSA